MSGYYEFEVPLAEIKPLIWRRFLISRDATFADLHVAIQDAFGWFEEHLWVFEEPGRQGKKIAGIPNEDDPNHSTPDAGVVALSSFFGQGDCADRCLYEYDFGDRWNHEVVIMGNFLGDGTFFQKLVAGERACPPEDCGGTGGYERIVDFLRTGIDPDGENAKIIAEWIGPWQPDEFHLAEFQEVFDR